MQQTYLTRAVYELGLLPCYQFEGKNYYDTREIFDRHNFARDVRRNVRPEDWLFLKPRYLLTEHGIVQFAFRKNVTKLIDKFMSVMDRPIIQEMPAAPYLPRPDMVIPPIQSVPTQPSQTPAPQPINAPQTAQVPSTQPTQSVPAAQIKYEEPLPLDDLVPPSPADQNVSWDAFEVPQPRHTPHAYGQHGTPGSNSNTPTPGCTPKTFPAMLTSQQLQVLHQAHHFYSQQQQQPQQQQQQQQQHQPHYVSSFLSLDEPYYPDLGEHGQLKRKPIEPPSVENHELPPNKRARTDESVYYSASPLSIQSPATYSAY